MNWLILFLLIFSIFTISYWATNFYQNDKFIKYVEVLSIFSTATFIFSFLMSLEKSKKEDQRKQVYEDEKKQASFTLETEKNWINLEKLFSDNYPYLAKLYKEMYPSSNIIVPELNQAQQIEQANKEEHVTQILYQTIENLISSQVVGTGSNWGWAIIFKSWAKSPTFQKNWSVSKQFYNPTTQAFIDNLISLRLSSIQDIQDFFHKAK